MTLGNAAAARVRMTVRCKECRHQVEPDPAEMAARYGAETPVLDWRERLVCSRCGGAAGRYGGKRNQAAVAGGALANEPSCSAGGLPCRCRGAGPQLRRLPLRRSAEDPKNDREDVSNCGKQEYVARERPPAPRSDRVDPCKHDRPPA